MDRWVFSPGTRFWKEFAFRENGNSAAPRRIETRYIEKVGADDWIFATYVWRQDESDAELAPRGGLPNVFPIGAGVSHDIPSVANCMRCHTRGGDRVLGFDALQLSADRERPTRGLTLPALAARGSLTTTPQRQPAIAASSREARRAMGYLHGNCAHCHNPQGDARGTELFLRHNIAGTGSERDEPAFATTINRRTRIFQIPGQAETFRIKPRAPESSAVLYRMRQRRNQAQMPPLGTKLEDVEATADVLRWIQGLDLQAH
jgi:hypothetical protein